MNATNNMRLAVALMVAEAAIAGTLWFIYGPWAFVLAMCAGWLDNLSRVRLEKAKRQVDDQLKGLGNGS